MLALHRYFFWTGTMRSRFAEARAEAQAKSEEADKDAHFLVPYLPYHLAGMYTLIEGWKRLDLHDAEVDALLDAEHLKLLEAFRHGVYHFHPEYYDEKFRGFWSRGQDAVDWSTKLFVAFDQFFRKWFTEQLEQLDAVGPKPE